MIDFQSGLLFYKESNTVLYKLHVSTGDQNKLAVIIAFDDILSRYGCLHLLRIKISDIDDPETFLYNQQILIETQEYLQKQISRLKITG